MKLHTIKIVFVQSRTVRLNVIGDCDSVFTNRYIITMYEITILLINPCHQGRANIIDLIPSHLWHLKIYPIPGRRKTQDLFLENAEAGGIVLLAILTHQLHTQANAENRLL